jgi:OOP family OmpA-OmpF porin
MTHRTFERGFGLAIAGLVITLGAGCGPIAFSDSSALTVQGSAPVAEAEPEPEPEEPKRVEVRKDKIVINEKVQFEQASDKILEVSHDLLNEVAQVIKDNPQIKKIEIQGHASSEGKDSYNLKLSDKRAKAVRAYLIKQGGVPEKTLTAKGYGETKPIADNETEEGREKNRRVEFFITKQQVTKTKVEVDAEGNETVVSEKKMMVNRGKKGKKGKKGRKGKKGKTGQPDDAE